MRTAVIGLVAAIAGCHGKPERDDCARALAQIVIWEELNADFGDTLADVAAEVGRDPARTMTAKEAWAVIKNHDVATQSHGHPGLDRVDDCAEHRSTGEVECMLDARSLEAAYACAPAARPH